MGDVLNLPSLRPYSVSVKRRLFLTIWMTSHTITDVINPFILMLLNYLLLIMTQEAVRRSSTAAICMTARTVTIRATMVQREPMVKVSISPFVCIMTVRTLSREMVLWWLMARLTVRQPCMAKVHILKVIRIAMTVTAAAGVVICRRLVAG